MSKSNKAKQTKPAIKISLKPYKKQTAPAFRKVNIQRLSVILNNSEDALSVEQIECDCFLKLLFTALLLRAEMFGIVCQQ